MHLSERLLDRLEALLTEWDCSPDRTSSGIDLASNNGVTSISAADVDPRQSPFGIPSCAIRARTNVSTATASYFSRLAPVLNRFAVFGAVTEDSSGLSIVSGVTITEETSHLDDKLILIGAAARWNADTTMAVAKHVARPAETPSNWPLSSSAWNESDLSAIAEQLRDTSEFVVSVDSESLSVGFQSGAYRVLVQSFLSAPHPTVGPGLLVGLEIISDALGENSREALVTKLNAQESSSYTGLDHLGAWCLGRFENSIGYVSFVPNALRFAVSEPSIEQRFVFAAINRGVLTTQRM